MNPTLAAFNKNCWLFGQDFHRLYPSVNLPATGKRKRKSAALLRENAVALLRSPNALAPPLKRLRRHNYSQRPDQNAAADLLMSGILRAAAPLPAAICSPVCFHTGVVNGRSVSLRRSAALREAASKLLQPLKGLRAPQTDKSQADRTADGVSCTLAGQTQTRASRIRCVMVAPAGTVRRPP